MALIFGSKASLLEGFVGECLLKMLAAQAGNRGLTITSNHQNNRLIPDTAGFDFFVENNVDTSGIPFKENDFYVEVKSVLTEQYLRLIDRRGLDYSLYIICAEKDVSKYKHMVHPKIHIFGLDFLEKLVMKYPETALEYHIGDFFPPLSLSLSKSFVYEKPRKKRSSDASASFPQCADSSKETGKPIEESLPRSMPRVRPEDSGMIVDSRFGFAEKAISRNGVGTHVEYERARNEDILAADYPRKTRKRSSKKNKNEWANFFSDEIASGTNVIMILGNGVSIDFGSASWSKLAASLSDYLFPVYSDNLGQLLGLIGDSKLAETQLASTIVSPKKYNNVLYNQIYGKFEEKILDDDTLLSAVGDVVEKTKITVATYNYDEFLEMYLSRRHHLTYTPVFDEESEEAAQSNGANRVFHLHGFMKYDQSEPQHEGKCIVLTMKDYIDNYQDGKWCADKQKGWLNDRKNKILFVGSSMTDAYQLSLIASTGIREHHVYALLPLTGTVGEKNRRSLEGYFSKMLVCPIFCDGYKALPKMLRELFGL